jgi:hypothetical protein
MFGWSLVFIRDLTSCRTKPTGADFQSRLLRAPLEIGQQSELRERLNAVRSLVAKNR